MTDGQDKVKHWFSTDIGTELKELTNRGFTVDPETGKISDFNANYFAKYVQSNYEILYARDGFFYSYHKGVWSKVQDIEILGYLRDILQKPRFGIWNVKRETEYLAALKRELWLDGELNPNRKIINMGNGVYNLSTMEFLPHSPEHLCTTQIPINYKPDAECPRFLQFIDEVFEGDQQRKDVAQEWYGYSLSPETKAQKALILYGGGANGKGVFVDTLSELVGEGNISHIPLNEVSRSFARVRLFNKLLNISSENETVGGSLNTQYFKAIVGEDMIEAEEKGKPVFSFRATCKLIFAMNSLPITRDRSEGYFRRLMILRFTAHFSERNRDRNLKTKLRKELPGIFNWALEGLKRLSSNNFCFSDSLDMRNALQEYVEELNPVLDFIKSNIKGEPGYKECNFRVYTAFQDWAKANGHTGFSTMSTQKFWREFEAAAKSIGLEARPGHSNIVRFHTGIRLVPDPVLAAARQRPSIIRVNTAPALFTKEDEINP